MALRRTLNRAYRDAVLRGDARCHWEMDVEWTAGTRTYSQDPDRHDPANGVYAWLSGVSGAAQRLALDPGGVKISEMDSSAFLLPDFFDHLAGEEIGGLPVTIYRAITGGTARQTHQRGIASGEAIYSGDLVEIVIVDALSARAAKTAPAYALDEENSPKAPGDSLGRPLISAVGRIPDWPLLLLRQPGWGELGTTIGPEATILPLTSATSDRFPADGVHGDLAAGIGPDDAVIDVHNVTGGDWPMVGGLAMIGPNWWEGEIVAWTSAEDIGGGTYRMTVARGYAGLDAVLHGAGAPVRVGRIIEITQADNTPEYAMYYSRAGDILTSIRRALYGSAARTHVAGDSPPTVVRIIRGDPYVYLVSDADISRDGDPEGVGLTAANIRRRGEEDFLESVTAGKLITFGDTDSIAGRTMTTAQLTQGPGSLVNFDFSSAANPGVDYGNQNSLDFLTGGYYIYPRFDPSAWTAADIDPDGHWTNEHDANDLDVATSATGNRPVPVGLVPITAQWKYSPPDAATASRIESVSILLMTGSDYSDIAVTVNVFSDAPDWQAFAREATISPAGANTQIWDVTAAADWESVSLDSASEIELKLIADNAVNDFSLDVVEIGLFAQLGGQWGWTDPDNAIDRGTGYESTYATWTAFSAGGDNQIDILALGARIGAGRAAGTASARIRHRETAVSGWDQLRIRIRTADDRDSCGDWVDITPTTSETDEWIALPLPTSGAAAAETVYVEIIAQGASPLNMYLYDAELRMTFDAALDEGVAASGVVALDMLGARDADGSITGTAGALIESPPHVAAWALRKFGEFAANDLSDESWADAAAHYAGQSWTLAGGITDQDGLDEHLRRILGGCLGAIIYDEESLRFWRWPTDAVPAMQFVASRRGPSNATGWSYRRWAITDVANDVTIYYQPRFFGSERRAAISGGVAMRGGSRHRDAFAREPGRPYPFIRQYQPGQNNAYVAESQRRYGARQYVRAAEWIADSTSAAALASLILRIWGFQRYEITFTVGDEGDLARLGDLIEWCHDELPRNCLRQHYANKWWAGIRGDQIWPAAIPSIYAVVTARERISDDEIQITALEWGNPVDDD